MSDLSNRARMLATREGILAGDKMAQRVAIWLALQMSMSEIVPYLRVDLQPPAKAMAKVLFDMAVLCSLWGTDIVDATASAVDQRELEMRKIVKGTLAPVPNAKTNDGTILDPAGRHTWDGADDRD